MQHPMPKDDTLRRAACLLAPDRPNAFLAQALRRPRGTIRAWLSGHRRAPPFYLRQIAAMLYNRTGDLALSFAQIIERRAELQEREPKLARGFCVVKMRNGILCDIRWRGGRGRF